MKDTTLELAAFSKEVHQVAVDHGFWTEPHSKTPLESLMLMVTELAEAAEEVRKGTPKLYQELAGGIIAPLEAPSWSSRGKPEGEAAELADCLIRILDHCEFFKIPLIEALRVKSEYNKTRPYLHGKLK